MVSSKRQVYGCFMRKRKRKRPVVPVLGYDALDCGLNVSLVAWKRKGHGVMDILEHKDIEESNERTVPSNEMPHTRITFGRRISPKTIIIIGVVIFLICGLIGSILAVVNLSHGSGRIILDELPLVDNVKFFILGFRHGNRNPTQFLVNDTSHEQWAWEGAGQLTSIGKRQSAALGQFLRERYSALVSNEFFPSQIKTYTSSAERCQQTLQTSLAGFYPPIGRSLWSSSVNWQPIPYEINDPLLRMYTVNCPYYAHIYQPISDDIAEGAYQWLMKDQDLVKYIAKHSGLNGSLSDLGDVADNIANMKLFSAPLPSWVTHPDLPGYPPKDIYTAITSFAEAHQILCANDPECSRMMAGLWLNKIIDTLQNLQSNKSPDLKAHFYSTHTEVVLSLIRLIQAVNISETSSSAGFILEYTDTPIPAVRFIFHEPHPRNADIRLARVKDLFYCQGQQWCPLEVFIENIREHAFSDWRAMCKLPSCTD